MCRSMIQTDFQSRNELIKRYFLKISCHFECFFYDIKFSFEKKVKLEPTATKSIFAQLQTKNVETLSSSSGKSEPMQVESRLDFGPKSHIVENADAVTIHKENTEFLQKMGENEILEEQKRLFGTIDPSIVQFLKEKRKAKLLKITENVASDIEMRDAKQQVDPLSAIDVLKDENSKHWLHFDVIEPAKLEWMRDLPKNMPELKSGEQYEARFDWKGVLLPFKPSENDVTVNSTELYLHGDDAHRPGYTLQELFRLARSTVVQQRLSAIKAIGGILSIYNQGYYDGIFELPISKVFFLLRYAFDDNTPSMLDESAKALSALFYNETDEVFKNTIIYSHLKIDRYFLFDSQVLLDMTFDCSFDGIEPTLEIQSDETISKGANLENQFAKMNIDTNVMQTNISDDDDKLSTMNDFHLAETDLIQCFLRTNILQRVT